MKAFCTHLIAFTLLTGALTGCGQAQTTTANHPATPEVAWLTDYDAALKQAQATNKLVVVDFFATWCGPCRAMERNTFADEKVRQRLADFVPVKIDVDKQAQISARYGIEAMPTTMILDSQGKPLATSVGYLKPAEYLAVLNQVKSGGTMTNSVTK